MIEVITERVAVLRKQKKFQDLLNRLWEVPDFRAFLQTMCVQCNVVNPVFSKDPHEIIWNEARRNYAMSILKMLAKDDIQFLIHEMEKYEKDRINNE